MNADHPCACEGGTLDRLIQPTVMALLATGPQHGYSLVERLTTSPMMKGSKPDDTGVYRLLKALDKQGMVTSRLAESDRGPGKRIYQLTACGRTCLARWLATLEAYRQDIGDLLVMLRDLSPGLADPPRCGRKG